jgi:hypothetical protein
VGTFEKVSAVSGGAGGVYTAEVDPLWTIAGRPNGGYLLAIMARAALAADESSEGADHPHPLSASALYVTSPEVGPAVITVEPLRRGRTASQLRARLSQAGQVRVEALFTLGRLAGSDEAPRFDQAPPVDVAPPEECRLSLVEAGRSGMRIEILGQVEQYLDRRSLRDPAFTGDLRGWLGFPDDAPFDPVSLLYAVDAFPPSTIQLGDTGWVPTLELTAYIRANPAPGRLRIRQRARVLTGGIVDQVCEVWDSRDRVVAQAAQIAAVRL